MWKVSASCDDSIFAKGSTEINRETDPTVDVSAALDVVRKTLMVNNYYLQALPLNHFYNET